MEGLKTHYLEDLHAGMTASHERTVSEADILLFADLTDDHNPVHVNAEFAATTQFKGRIAHGMLTASLLSAVLGTKLPGPGAIFMSLNIRFRAPVKIGDTVVATATVKEIITEKKRVVMDLNCSVLGKTVLEGDAMLMVSSRAEPTT